MKRPNPMSYWQHVRTRSAWKTALIWGAIVGASVAAGVVWAGVLL